MLQYLLSLLALESISVHISSGSLNNINRYNQAKMYIKGHCTESEIFVRNFRKFKNKYDLTLCQSRLHCLRNFRPSSKNSDQVQFSAFSHP